MVKAEGNQGYFLQRMTPTYSSSNGRLDVWWDNRSDFNANGEKAVYAGVLYDLAKWDLPGSQSAVLMFMHGMPSQAPMRLMTKASV